ncbi:IclR family transcriptional regulator [Rhodococcus sp. SGAir0479]|uniref:IclR family transcriptional regulator n=1 Tax=Rhodococcus sp. SGAir0479 TaxID=2567884 RepID=UPI0010CD12EF|nr:IclR family transcriptional regulator [Rhodococcus sp. SGAir0479]QCQ89853.1 IclR family transcriptional regulator [Rhodococcus sp. SGAir0479]
MTTTATSSPIAVIDRVAVLLDVFREAERLTLSELSRRTGFPRSSTHRMLLQLVRIGWIRRHGHAYELGMKMLELGSLAQHHDRVHQAALPVLHELHNATGLVVHLAVLDGSDVLYLEKLGGRFTLAVPSRVGGRQPAYRTAIGKALLANTRIDAETVLPDPVSGPTQNSIGDAARLRVELARVREQSIAHDRDETAVGVSCVAAAIGDGKNTVGAISVCGPSKSMNSSALVAPVRMAALATWRHMTASRAFRHIPA